MTNLNIHISSLKSELKRQFSVRLIFTLLVGVMLLCGCRDEFDDLIVRDDSTQHNVTLLIPSVKGVAEATRAGEPESPLEEEADMKTLYLYAYPTDGSQGKRFKISEPTLKTSLYAQYNLTLRPGVYRIYVVGNLEPYLDEGELKETISEEDLRSLILKFSPNRMPNVEDGLPMGAFTEDIQETLNGELTVAANKKTTFTVNLKFLVAKVRLTLFFNAENPGGYSYSGFDASRPDFEGIEILNTPDKTKIDREAEPEYELFKGAGKFTRMKYPEDLRGANDPISLEEESLIRKYEGMDEMTKETEGAALTSKMSWQTILYLPENMTDETEKATTLYLRGTLDGKAGVIKYRVTLPPSNNDGQNKSVSPLRRAQFYDLTACVKDIAREFEMNVLVNEWTVNTLAHTLHGPYHLEVEQTDNVPVTAGEETLLGYKSDVTVSFESEKIKIGDTMVNTLIITKQEGHEDDTMVITSNPALPLNIDMEETYFYVVAGNLKKKITVRPFAIKPFLTVTPLYTAVEVREVIEAGNNDLYLPVKFTSNLPTVKIRLTDGWTEADLPVKFHTAVEPSERSGNEIVYKGESAREQINNLFMFDFINGNPFWSENSSLFLEYTAYDEEDNAVLGPVKVEFEIIPKRFRYRIYFRPENDDWAAPHIYVYQSLALPKALDSSKLPPEDSYYYSSRHGKPVGGYVFREPGRVSEAALQYSFTGKVTFRGWNTQGGPACNDPYEVPVLRPYEAEGFYVFGTHDATSGPQIGKTGYGVKYIPPSHKDDWMNTGGDEASIRAAYDIDTDYMSLHRSQLKKICPSCVKEYEYNMKFPGIRMLESEKYPGWWYVDLTDVATPGKALIMIHDGHDSNGLVTVPLGNNNDNKSGIPLFDYPDNEGWLYYKENVNPNFTDKKPSDAPALKDRYRICWPKDKSAQFQAEMMNAAGNRAQCMLIDVKASEDYYSFNPDFNYVEFTLGRNLQNRDLHITLTQTGGQEFDGMVSLSQFKMEDGIRYYTFTGSSSSHPGKPTGGEASIPIYRLYWPQSAEVIGINFWLSNKFVINNWNNNIWSVDGSVDYKSGTEYFGFGDGDMAYDYYEFQIAEGDYTNSGWQLHLESGPYQYQQALTLNDFRDNGNTGYRSVYRDPYHYTHFGTPPSGNKFRICWPKIFYKDGVPHTLEYAWLYGVHGMGPDDGGAWVKGEGTVKKLGVEYYYCDFEDDTEFRVWGNTAIIPRTTNDWTTGIGAVTAGICFRRYDFKYDGGLGINIGYVTTDFTMLEK